MTQAVWSGLIVLGQNGTTAGTPATQPAATVPGATVPGATPPGDTTSTVGDPGTAKLPPAGPAGGGGMGPIMWLLPAMLVVMILVSVMGGRKEKKRRAELMGSLKKNDKVQTAGGIIGTIAEMSDTDVVLRLEEGRVRIARSAIQGVIGPAKAASTAEVKPEAKSLV